jgi:hypothetical protein
MATETADDRVDSWKSLLFSNVVFIAEIILRLTRMIVHDKVQRTEDETKVIQRIQLKKLT